MDYKLIIAIWAIFAVSVIYWDQHRWQSGPPTSACHDAAIVYYKERARCTECGKYCEVSK